MTIRRTDLTFYDCWMSSCLQEDVHRMISHLFQLLHGFDVWKMETPFVEFFSVRYTNDIKRKFSIGTAVGSFLMRLS